jgi:hypothetical protein
MLFKRMKEIDGKSGPQLWVIDLLEITKEFREETLALWNAAE